MVNIYSRAHVFFCLVIPFSCLAIVPEIHATIRCHPREFLGEVLEPHRALIATSMYALQLERWFTLFGRENVKVRKTTV